MNTGRRFKNYDTKLSPGPGYYRQLGDISEGVQVCTNFHSTITKNMGTTEPRTQWGGNPRFRTPGPGTYKPPSDFGYLEFKSTMREREKSLVMVTEQSQTGLQLALEDSIRSDVKSFRKNNVMFKTLSHQKEPKTSARRKASLANAGHQSSRIAGLTQESTLASVNASQQSPRGLGASETPMAHMKSVGFDSALEAAVRLTKTPQGKDLPL